MSETTKQEQHAALLAAAKEASANSYCPFSKLKVGAAIQSHKGNVFTGCNVENPSYGAVICAERSALGALVTAEGPNARISAIAVSCDGANPCYPCGICRQSLLPFYDESSSLIVEENGALVCLSLAELLPNAFRGW